MASADSRKSFLSYFGGAAGDHDYPEADLEFDESDVWNPNNRDIAAAGKILTSTSDQTSSTKKSVTYFNNNDSRPLLRKPTRKSGGGGRTIVAAAATSLPVNIPDWSRILQQGDQHDDHEYKKSRNNIMRRDQTEDYEEEDEEFDKLPPHEYLAARSRSSGWSFSVQEGIGRTLKGRDLSRVRNAVWKQTGFED